MAAKKLDTIFGLILFSLLVIFSLLVPPIEGIYRWVTIAVLLFIVAYFSLRRPPLLGPSLFLLMCYLFRLLPFVSLGLLLIVPILVYTALVLAARPLRKDTTWLAWGAVTPRLAVYSLVVVIVSSGALVLWYRLLHPDIAVFTRFFPPRPLYQLLVGGLGFALLNAIVEEVIYRGIIWQGLTKLIGTPWAVLVVQALFFGAAHIWGVPNGVVGVALAFIYGIMLGLIRMRAGGLLMAIITHVFADVVIFVILLEVIGRI